MKCIACGDTRKIADPITGMYRFCEFCHPGAATNKTKPVDHLAMGDRAKTFKGLVRKIEQLEKERDILMQAHRKIVEAWKEYDRGYSDYKQGYDDALADCCEISESSIRSVEAINEAVPQA